MRRMLACATAAGLWLATLAAAADDDKGRAAPLGTPTRGEEPDVARATPPSVQNEPQRDTSARSLPAGGRPENRWRYRFAGGRWWYWTPDRTWSYFDGNRWVAYRSGGGFRTEKVDPALLSLEAKEGVLGNRRWQNTAGADNGWIMSGTRGSFGGASTPSAPFQMPWPGGMGGAWGGGGWAPTMGGAPRGR